MRLALGLVAAIVVLAAYLLLWPVPIEPVRWHAEPAPPAEAYPANDRLKDVERLAESVGAGPEGIAVDTQGRIYAGYDDGRVMRFDGNGQHGELLVNTGGRPLGISVGRKGVFIADANKGLLQLQGDGTLKVLATAADGVAFRFVDDVDQSDADPYIYFSDASARFGIDALMADTLEHGDSGRLLRYDPAAGQATTLLRGLHFANGVAVGPDAEYVLVSETAEYRVHRYWLKGERAGQDEVFVDNLPGFPDNLSYNGRKRVWLALYAPRNRELDALSDQPLLRKIVYRLPAFLRPKPVLHSWVLALDLDGKLDSDLQYAGEPGNHEMPRPYGPVTSVEQYGATLYLGSLSDTAIGRIAVPSPAAAPSP